MTSAKDQPEPSRLPAAVTVALVAVAVVFCVAVGLATRNVWVGVMAAVLVAGVSLLGWAWRLHDERERRARFVADFGGSLDAVRDALDLDRLRAIRDERGELHAVRDTRRQVPQVTLEQALHIVRTL